MKFWSDHLNRHNITHSGFQERFGQHFIRLNHPCGLQLEVIEDAADPRHGWTTNEISADVTTRGFHGPVLSVREIAETEGFFIDALGFRKTGVDGAYHRFEIGAGGVARTVTLLHEPDRPAGSWIFGAGTAHHLALEVENDEKLAEQKALYDELGYTDCSEIKDRLYFHSIYCRCPGGILVECAATAPRAALRLMNQPINSEPACCCPRGSSRVARRSSRCWSRTRVPESNRRAGISASAPVKAPVPASSEEVSGAPASRRTDAVFIRK